MWTQFDSGSSIGITGSEDGVIVLDEEHLYGARVTLERDGSHAPWSVTCGIYGAFLHTAFASSEAEGREKYEHMKSDLVRIMQTEDDELRYQEMSDFAAKY